MNKETRIIKISEEIERYRNNPYGKQEIFWKDELVSMPVFKIPLDYLIYNKYNGRILSRTKSLESQGVEIDVESPEGRARIEELLWESNPVRNKTTLESIRVRGQEKVGIITRDGIIIDGNRRAMLLKRSDEYDYFKCVVLDVTIEEDSLEIQKLETTYQMGEDEKLGYNPIEKYIKAKELKKRGVPLEKIAEWMGESDTKIKEYLDVADLMDDYLDYLSYNGMYTQLDNREDQFINLSKWLQSFYDKSSARVGWDYRNDDVDDLKNISYDYIRVKYEGKEFRNIADGLKENHFFGDKNIWQSFRDYHFVNIEPIRDNEAPIDLQSENLEAHLNDRDKKFFESTQNETGDSFLQENIRIHKQKIQNKKSADEPLKLVRGAIDSLEAINIRHPAFSTDDVMSKIELINEKTENMLLINSPERLLLQVVRILKSIDVQEINNFDEDKVRENLKSIQKIAYDLEKKFK